MRTLSLLFLLCAFYGADALYSAQGDVKILDESNFQAKLRDGAWMVEFYAPWCGHCQSLKPEWEKAAKALKGIVNVGAVDADAHKQLGGQFGVRGFPTIKFMYNEGGKVKSVDYGGGRTAKDIVSFAMDKAKALALKRIGEKAQSASGSSSKGGAAGSFYPSSSSVVNLNDSTFDDVLESDDLWFVEFYAPWCGYCKQLKPEYTEAAQQLAGKVKVGAINCDEEKALCSRYGVQGFPTIKFFGKNKRQPSDYQGARDASGLVQYGTQAWAKHAPAPEVRELTDGGVFGAECLGDGATGARQLCFVAFLPDILDTGAAGRNALIKLLERLAERYKDRPYSYFWVQGGLQPALEANMEVGGFGYPAMAALSPSRKMYVPFKAGFELKHLQDYIDGIRQGTEAALPLRGELADLATIDAWDGKDGQLIEEDEFDLDELMNEEL